MIQEYLIKKALDRSFRIAKNVAISLLGEKGAKLSSSKVDFEQSLDLHLRSIKNWSEEVSFTDLKQAKRTTDIFIELDLYVQPRRVRIEGEAGNNSIPLRSVFDRTDNHIILLGQPGAGKTTSMKFLCQLLLHDDAFQTDRFSFPVLLKFREFDRERAPGTSLIFDRLFDILGLRIDFPKELLGKGKAAGAARSALKEKLVINFLEEFRVLLILEGFDELEWSHRVRCVAEITRCASQLERCTMVVTSRTGEFRYSIDNSEEYELCPLNEEQIGAFATRWLKDEQKAREFVAKVNRSPFADTAIRPLTLAHLCAIYERIRDIPDKPKTVYRKIVNLLLEEWDQQRAIKRSSKYAEFEIDRKYEFLCHLAYQLTVSEERTVFSSRNLIQAYRDLYEEHGLVAGEAKQVAAEIESHNGLLLQTGYDQYEFAHKSIQEFLTAEFLVKLPSMPEDWGLINLPNELAIVVAISSQPSLYFSELVLTRLRSQRLSNEFLRAFLSRLLLERPDFKAGTLLELALLELFTLYVEFDVSRHRQLRSYQSDTILRALEDLILRNYRTGMVEILRSYETMKIYEMVDRDDILKLVLVDKFIPQQFQQLKDKFPAVLLVRSSLLNKIPN